MTQVAPSPEAALPFGAVYTDVTDMTPVTSDSGLNWQEMDLGELSNLKYDLLSEPTTSPDLLAAIEARQRELITGFKPLTVIQESTQGGAPVVRGGTTLDREKAQATINAKPSSLSIVQEGPRTITGHYEKQLAQAKAELEDVTERGHLRLSHTRAEADRISSDAEQQANELLEPARLDSAARLAHAEGEAGRVRDEGSRRAARITLVATDQLTKGVPALLEQARKGTDIEDLNEIDYSLLEQDVPPALPLDMLQQLVQYSGKGYLDGAKRYADQLRIKARTNAIAIEAAAQSANEKMLRPLQEQADAILARADRLAHDMVAEVEQEVRESIARAQERVDHLKAELELRREKERPSKAVSSGTPTVFDTKSPDKSTAIDQPSANKTAGAVATANKTEDANWHAAPTSGSRRHSAPNRRWWVTPVSAAAAGAFAVGVVFLPHLGNAPQSLTPRERLADNDAAVPKWFPGKAWQQELAKALQDPRVTVGPNHENYVLGNSSTMGTNLGAIPELLMFLGSMDNEHIQTGLVPMHTQTAEAIAKKMNIEYVVETADGKVKATPKTAYDTILVTVKRSNEILDSMFKNPADKKAYLADPQKLLTDFAKLWQINDQNGNAVALPAPFQQAFVAIGVDMMKGSDHSDALQALLNNQDVQNKLKTVSALLKKEGVLTNAEEKSEF